MIVGSIFPYLSFAAITEQSGKSLLSNLRFGVLEADAFATSKATYRGYLVDCQRQRYALEF